MFIFGNKGPLPYGQAGVLCRIVPLVYDRTVQFARTNTGKGVLLRRSQRLPKESPRCCSVTIAEIGDCGRVHLPSFRASAKFAATAIHVPISRWAYCQRRAALTYRQEIMKTAIGQEWRRNKSDTYVRVMDRMFHLGEWWILVAIQNPKKRRHSWWTREEGFIGKYTILEDSGSSPE